MTWLHKQGIYNMQACQTQLCLNQSAGVITTRTLKLKVRIQLGFEHAQVYT